MKYEVMADTMKKMSAYINSLSPKERKLILKNMGTKMALTAESYNERRIVMPNEESDNPQLWESCIMRADGTKEVIGYAYGPSWVAQALSMDDLKFKTPEEAENWWKEWEKKHGNAS